MRPVTTRTRTILTSALLAVAPASVATIGCRPRHESVAADSTFVRAMGDLRLLAANASLDSLSRQRARDSILRHYATSEGDLERIARELARDPDHAVAVLRKIDLRARSVPPPAPVTAPPGTLPGGTVRPGTTPRTAPGAAPR
jgi:hypothetical protein